MNLNYFFGFILLYTIGSTSFAQSKKDVKKNKISSITEFISITENGKAITYKSYYVGYDKNGKIIEETEFNKDGSIKKKKTFRYNNNDTKIEETGFEQTENKSLKKSSEPEKHLNIKTTYKYNANNDKTEETDFDVNTGKLIKKQVFSYNNKGEKIVEETFDGENKLIKKITSTYDNKGLKTEKKTFNKENVLEITKKYTYEF